MTTTASRSTRTTPALDTPTDLKANAVKDIAGAINATLADPPLFDLSGSDQLGLFIAGQLAKRHNVRLTLRVSAYGGITAVLLIPSDLVVDFDESDADPLIAGIRELGGRPVPQLAAAAPVTPPVGEDVTANMAWHEITGYDWAASGSGPATLRPVPGDGSPRDEEPEDSAPVPPPPAAPETAAAEADAAPVPAAQATTGELDGLPVRVRQANLAHQLREPVSVTAEASLVADVPSPDAARSTMAALQLGWQRGRTAAPGDQDDPVDHDLPRRGGRPQKALDEGGTS